MPQAALIEPMQAGGTGTQMLLLTVIKAQGHLPLLSPSWAAGGHFYPLGLRYNQPAVPGTVLIRPRGNF